MQTKKWKNLLWGLVFMLLVACTPATSPSQATDDAQIFAAATRQIYMVDDTFGGNFQAPTLYIIRTLDDTVGDPETVQMEETRVLAEEITAVISSHLSDLPTNIIWVDSFADVPLDAQEGHVEGGGAAITLGNIHLQDDGSIHIPASIYVANLGAGGQTYILEQVDGQWTITGTTGVQWMS